MRIYRLASLIFFMFFASQLFAQNKQDTLIKVGGRNYVKVNLIGIAIKNYQLQYESALSKRISIAVSYRTMPENGIPFGNFIANGDATVQESLDKIKFSNSAITPEIRFYFGKKGYGKGFYIAPFFRTATFKASGYGADFTSASGGQATINLSGKVSAKTYGLLLGAQWSIGKHLCIDWQIIGPHYGRSSGEFSGISTTVLNAAEQTELSNTLQDINIPFATQTISVNSTGATVGLNSAWAGIRSSIGFGLKF